MGLFGKTIKSVVGNNVSSLVGTNKNDVKVAKYEMKKAKIEQKNNDQKQRSEDIKGVLRYVGSNIDAFESQLDSLSAETEKLIGSLESINGYGRATKRTQRNTTEKIEENINYIHLSKTFFSFLSKVAIGIKLTENQYIFIEKFFPFFDGIKVLSDDYSNEEDDSLLGAFKEVGIELASAFVSVKKSFTFDDYLLEFDESTNNYTIPDYKTSISSFRKAYSQNDSTSSPEDHKDPANTSNTTVCTNCNASVSKNMKFCPECGESLIPKTIFCSECGNKCDFEMKFCPSCGHKMHF